MVALVAGLGVIVGLLLTRARPLDAAALPRHAGDAARGEVLYHASSCGSCHKAADGAPGHEEGLPTGSAPFATPVGVFYPGNLTPDPSSHRG